MAKVLLVTKGIEHPSYVCRKNLIRMLMGMEGISYKHIMSLDQMPKNIQAFDAMVLYFHEGTESDTEIDRFGRYVFEGGGVLAIHSVTASYMESDLFFEIIGGRFKRHGEIKPFELMPVEGKSLFKGILPFIVEDELYEHDLQPGITPHFIALGNEEEIPMVWTHHYGKGRVCYASPGHRPETMCHPDYQNLIRQGLS